MFEKLYQEKGIVADKTLAIHTGQFFRALSTDYVRLYPGTQQMLASLKKWTKKYICYRMPSAFLPHMK